MRKAPFRKKFVIVKLDCMGFIDCRYNELHFRSFLRICIALQTNFKFGMTCELPVMRNFPEVNRWTIEILWREDSDCRRPRARLGKASLVCGRPVGGIANHLATLF